MRSLVLFGMVGFFAQLIDGALGMAYGATSATLLLAVGLTPALASASIHLAEVGTTLASGTAHWRFGNIDWPTVRRIALPGAAGALAGATVLSQLDGDWIKGWVAGFLMLLGVYVLTRFALFREGAGTPTRRPWGRGPLAGLGVFAGFMDAIGGGGWGPIATPTLLVSRTLDPRRVVGSVDTSEFLVALAASVGFLVSLGASAIDWRIVAALLLGGVAAAPLAAYLVRALPASILGTSVGGLILLTNARTLLRTFEVDPAVRWVVYAAILLLWIALLARSIRLVRGDGRRLVPVPVSVEPTPLP